MQFYTLQTAAKFPMYLEEEKKAQPIKKYNYRQNFFRTPPPPNY